ncbi:TonB-dependent receptor [Stakelama sediminis]|uniref:Outer membrane receptor protein involved in Fe transport n=1 Tax=Stakelama sediminis TaxID=463200 RepID=A0A840YYE4_9SPHN|nr:TonB-dependent receptor [Stakelama sediminis]MBB5718550.1 outer membrane receptor protein involved in Fe transport [Stakelama sediminis]
MQGIRTFILGTTALCVLAGTANAQAVEQQPVQTKTDQAQAVTVPATPAPADAPATDQSGGSDIVVVGTQIRGSQVTEALPVTVVNDQDIAATGAVSGDELLRSIPQMGAVDFNSSNGPQTSNTARGDVNSIDLRNLGPGNTLVLINGRRVVMHPVSQAGIGNVPVLTYNANALPVAAIKRLEVLRDGAAAIYGADAVAGVVNVVLKDDFQGLDLNARYGLAEGTNLHQFNTSMLAGTNFGGGRGNITLMAEYTHRTAELAQDEPYTASNDLRPLFADVPGYSDSTAPDNRSSYTSFANFSVVGGTGVRQNGSTITSGAGSFHIQPATVDGCTSPLPNGMCIAKGSLSYGRNRELRFDNAVGTTVKPSVDRINLYATGHYDFTDHLTGFVEAGYYRAVTHAIQPPVIALNDITVPASNYWNPFGATTLPDGSPNPNRLPGLTNVPASGLPVTLTRYRFLDTGPQYVDVTGHQMRFVGGLRGNLGNFDWETAMTYSEAKTVDISDNINSTLLQQQLALATPDAYDPFNGGGCDGNFSVGDCTPSSAASVAPFLFKMRREDRTSLTTADAKLSNSQLFFLPGGAVGLAVGLGFRHETQSDNRDPNLDGTNTFTDSVTGETNESNVIAVSPTPDTFGSRNVISAYGEFAVPVISPDMRVPLVRKVELQLAGRFEHYSDFGSIFVPKVAGAWDVIDGIRLRGSWSKGFKAPNLEQLHAAEYGRLATNNDYIRCEADLRAGRIVNFNDCSEPVGYSIRVAGNPDLQPERSTDTSFGIVLQPRFIPSRLGRLTITADYWQIKQRGIVGQFGGSNALVQDYLSRLQGTSNANVVRAAPTSDDVAFFAGTGITPVGQVLSVNDQFVNLLPQTVRGIDLNLIYALHDTPVGNFDLKVNVAHLMKFERDNGPAVDALYAARDAGVIDPATPLTNSENLLARGSRPKWAASGTLTWSLGPVQVGAFGKYTGVIYDNSFLSDDGVPYRVGSQFTANLYVQYTVKNATPISGMKFRVGARNITNQQPLISQGGYYGALYQPYGRYVYASVGLSL